MAEGSRPISRPYEGQRVNPIPDGFLAAYANVGKTLADTGETLGKGIGTAIAAYVESNKKADTLKGTFNSLAPRVKTAIDRIDMQLAAASPDVSAGALDETNTNDEIVVYRALSRAREDLVGGIGKFEDMSNSKKEQWLGSAANLIKFAEDKEEDDYKRGRDKSADETARINAEAKKTKEDRLRAAETEAANAKNLPTNLSNAFNRALNNGRRSAIETQNRRRETSERIIALEGMKAMATTPEEKKIVQDEINNLTEINVKEEERDREVLTFIGEKQGEATIKDPQAASTYLQILKDQRRSLLGGIPDVLKQFEDGTAVSVDKDGNMAGFTLDPRTLDAIPSPVRKELQYLQADIVALERSLAPQKDDKGNPVKTEFRFVPPSAALRADGYVKRQRAQTVYLQETGKYGYTPSAVELDWIADLAEYDGAVTDDGYRIEIDPKTGRISGTKDQAWVAFNAKNPLLRTQEEIDKATKTQQELNIISYQQKAILFGTALPNGEQRARRWVFDSMLGVNNVYIRGEAQVDPTRVTEIHKKIRMTNDEMSALSSIIRTISVKTKDAEGKETVVFKKDATGETVTVRGQSVPEVQDITKLPDGDRRALAIGIANFIRIRAEKLGVLSAQDWAYLDTLVPQISSQFVENIKAGQSVSSLMPKILDYIITDKTIKGDSIISNAITLMADARTALTTELKNTPAKGTTSGFLEVTGGLARYESGEPFKGEALDRWYDVAITSDFDTQNETNDLQDAHARLKIAYETRKASDTAKTNFQKARIEYRAFLQSRGMDTNQVNQIIKRYFASEE